MGSKISHDEKEKESEINVFFLAHISIKDICAYCSVQVSVHREVDAIGYWWVLQ